MKKSIPEEIKNEVSRVWGERILDYELNKISNTYITEDGRYITFEKPSIKTSFCYGYGSYGMSTDEDRERADSNCESIKKKERFIQENLRESFDYFEETMENPVLRSATSYKFPDGNLWVVVAGVNRNRYDRGRYEFSDLTENDKGGIRKVLLEERDKFMKRLETYWKRYGSSKLEVWSYLCD